MFFVSFYLFVNACLFASNFSHDNDNSTKNSSASSITQIFACHCCLWADRVILDSLHEQRFSAEHYMFWMKGKVRFRELITRQNIIIIFFLLKRNSNSQFKWFIDEVSLRVNELFEESSMRTLDPDDDENLLLTDFFFFFHFFMIFFCRFTIGSWARQDTAGT